jgi:hypothetical protein
MNRLCCWARTRPQRSSCSAGVGVLLRRRLCGQPPPLVEFEITDMSTSSRATWTFVRSSAAGGAAQIHRDRVIRPGRQPQRHERTVGRAVPVRPGHLSGAGLPGQPGPGHHDARGSLTGRRRRVQYRIPGRRLTECGLARVAPDGTVTASQPMMASGFALWRERLPACIRWRGG